MNITEYNSSNCGEKDAGGYGARGKKALIDDPENRKYWLMDG